MIEYMKILLLGVLLAVAVSVTAGEENRVFYSFDASNGLADNSAQTIKCTKTGRMVVTTIGHINFYDGDAFTHIDYKEQAEGELMFDAELDSICPGLSNYRITQYTDSECLDELKSK